MNAKRRYFFKEQIVKRTCLDNDYREVSLASLLYIFQQLNSQQYLAALAGLLSRLYLCTNIQDCIANSMRLLLERKVQQH